MASFDIDIDVYEYYFSMSNREIQKMIKLLRDDGHLDKNGNSSSDNRGYRKEAFNKALDYFEENYHSLSLEDIDLIISMSK